MTFSVRTFGCKVNFYESEAIREELLKAGFEEAEDDADYFIVNTCAVTLTAEKKCLQLVRRLAREHPQAKIAVLGCSAQISKERYEAVAQVGYVLGNTEKSQIVGLLEGKKTAPISRRNLRNESYDRQSISFFGREVRAFVKIQDGCDNFCSYCVIPQSRGNSRSRPLAEILAEVERLAANGYREIVLTGIDMGSYREPESGIGFSELLSHVLKTADGRLRVRISSLEESQIDARLLALFDLYPESLVPHLHIPLQSGSSHILKLMRRKYDLEDFRLLVARLRRRLPQIALSTDVIVGFPGETAEDFEKTADFVREIGFMRLHVFPYSRRPNTPASLLSDQVEPAVKEERTRALIAIGRELSERYRRAQVGRRLELLVEEKCGPDLYRGYTENYLDLEVSAETDLTGRLVPVALAPDLGVHLIK